MKLNVSGDGKFTVSDLSQSIEESDEKSEKEEKRKLRGEVVGDAGKYRFVPEVRFEGSREFLQQFYEDTTKMGLTEGNTNKIFEMSKKLIEAHTEIILKSLEVENQANQETVHTIKETSKHMTNEFNKISTKYKRLKELRNNELFVEPKEMTLALKWRTKTHSDSDLPSHRLVPSTGEFISIPDTLKALLSQPDFQSMYINYNTKDKHQCQDDIYADFCCGSIYKNKEIFRDPLTIQLQMGMDDFEICDPLKTKATLHKICGIYFQIRNLPANIKSKIDNFFLVALVSSEDLKRDEVLNDVNKIIFEQLSKLETIGFESTDGKMWKAALVNISCDNLGANFLFGFSKGFNARYYCRLCTMRREECEVSTHEIDHTIRTKHSHQENLELLKEEPSSSLQDSKGVRMECIYNKLESYHMFENVSLDIMHDMHEGLIHFYLSSFFEHCISKGISNEKDLVRRIRDFNYGPLFEEKKPSLLNLNKTNLGQNAVQSYCLLIHLPFIFYDLKHRLQPIWPTLVALLICFKIVLSIRISESDLKRLDKYIEIFLDGMIKLKGKLIPKAHNLIHYVNAIRKVGALRHLWMFRFECKHQFFKDAAAKTRNFINIKKTLAFKHQEQICLKKYSIEDSIEEAKRSVCLIRDHTEFAKYETFFNSIVENIDFDYLFMLPFLKFNNYVYKRGLILVENKLVYEIIFVLKYFDKYYFLCELYETKMYEESLNSIEIQKYCPDQQLAYIKHSDLFNKQSFPKKICNEKTYIIAENLFIFNSIPT